MTEPTSLADRLTAHAYALATMAPETAPATLNLLREAAARIARLESDVKAYREDAKEAQRDHREAMLDAAAEARREAMTGDPYGTY